MESHVAALRLRTDAAKLVTRLDNAAAVLWKLLLVAQPRYRRLDAPELLKAIYHGDEYVNGVRGLERA